MTRWEVAFSLCRFKLTWGQCIWHQHHHPACVAVKIQKDEIILSGSGSPFSIVLIRPDIDVWNPGEHSGTFRGNNFAFVTAGAMCKLWSDTQFTAGVERTAVKLQRHLDSLVAKFPKYIEQKRGRGLMAGLKCRSQALSAVCTMSHSKMAAD
ncbi:aminotransferase class III-fold pyridoxal phosphate-dependent enzyme [Mesorhizobium sp. M1050]